MWRSYSQGGAIAHNIVHEHELPDELRLLVTYGSGLNKLSELRSTIISDKALSGADVFRLADVLFTWKFAPLSALVGFTLIALSAWPVLTRILESIPLSILGWWVASVLIGSVGIPFLLILVGKWNSKPEKIYYAFMGLLIYAPIWYGV
jgi:hypothetical protein